MKRACALLILAGVGSVRADERIAQDPTVGLDLPGMALAGDAHATAVTANPANLTRLAGLHIEAAGTVPFGDRTSLWDAGAGLWVGTQVSLPFLPKLGFGASVEKRVPDGSLLLPDPGNPLRLSLAMAVQTGSSVSFGASLHHFMDGSSSPIAGVVTVDLGLETRLGGHFAAGLVVRNLLAPVLDSGPSERRWDGELILRPAGDDVVELALGASVDDRRGRFDPRLRVSARLAHGLYLRGEVEARTRLELPDPASLATERTYQARAALGLEVSLGGVGASVYGVGAFGAGTSSFGMAASARYSQEDYPSLAPPEGRIVRAKLSGDLDSRELIRTILGLRRVADDRAAVALLLQLEGLSNGWGTLQELRDAIHRVRARGKKVFVYLTAGGTRDYYVATAADRIYLDAAGGVRLVGLATQSLYFKELFDKVGVDAEFVKIAEYKSAPEQFTLSGSSPAAREMRTAILDDVYAHIVADIAKDRGKSEAEVRQLIDEGPYTAGEAGAAGVVDAVVEPNDVDRLVLKELGRRYPVADDLPRPRDESWARPQIAIISIEGDIVDGKSLEIPIIEQRLSGGETLAAAIDWARSNPRVAAIVLRIESPGGSALASDVIAREVAATRGKKPIVVSIGDLAASGGYFAAAPADLIFAEPSAITGSIGIFTGKFDFSGLAKRLGITWETNKRGARADMESYFRPYTGEERTVIEQKLRYFYRRFVSAVSRGRRLSETEVDNLGRGRVWTGAQALDRRLVDRFGGLHDAIREAKKRAGFDEDDRLEVLVLPYEPDTLVGKLLKLAGGGDSGDALAAFRPVLRSFPGSLLVSPDAPQARLPFQLVIE